MNNTLPDKTIILILVTTIILVFCLIFTFLPKQDSLQPDIEWRDSQLQNYETI